MLTASVAIESMTYFANMSAPKFLAISADFATLAPVLRGNQRVGAKTSPGTEGLFLLASFCPAWLAHNTAATKPKKKRVTKTESRTKLGSNFFRGGLVIEPYLSGLRSVGWVLYF